MNDLINQKLRHTLEKCSSLIHSRYEIFLISTIIFISRWSTLIQPLVERHDFRQTQTAFTTLTMANGAGGLFSSKLPIFGSPWELPFEFPLFQYIASIIYRLFDTNIDFANRLTSLIFFCLCLFPIHAISLRIMTRRGAFLNCLYFAFSPFAIQWSRSSLIEYCVLFFGLLFIFYSLKYWGNPSWKLFILASLSGALTGLVKVTTLLPMMIFLAFLFDNKSDFLFNFRVNRSKILGLSSIFAFSLMVAQAWALFSDSIRSNNPATQWLTQSNLNFWTFGTFTQRKSIENWRIIFDRIDILILPEHFTIVILLMGLLFVKSRRITIAAISASVITIAIFFNLYVVHDYYLVALSVFFSFIFASALDSLIGTMKPKRARFLMLSLLIPIVIGYSVQTGRPYWKSAYIRYPRGNSELGVLSSPDQQVFVSWSSWNPLILYYANRKGMMLDSRSTSFEYLRNLKDLDRYDFYAGNPDRPDVMQIRGFYSPVGRNTTRIDDNLTDFQNYGLVFSRNRISSTMTNSKTASIKCDGATVFDLRRFRIGTVIQTTPFGSPRDFGVSFNLQSIPIGRSIKILSALPETNTGKLVCSGGGYVRFNW